MSAPTFMVPVGAIPCLCLSLSRGGWGPELQGRIVCLSTTTSRLSPSEQARFNATLPQSQVPAPGADPEKPRVALRRWGSEQPGARPLAPARGRATYGNRRGHQQDCPWPGRVSRLFNQLPAVSSVNSDDDGDVCPARSGRADVRKPTKDRGEFLESSGMWGSLAGPRRSADGWLPGACSLR